MSKNFTSTLCLAADAASLVVAVSVLCQGGLVAFPTETVYGLGADATNPHAVAGIYAAKERPQFNPLIAHVASLEAAQEQGVFNAAAIKLAHAFWPGPLTLVLKAAPSCTVSDLARSGLETLALRVPNHPLALALLAQCSFPMVAPSANRSGRISPTAAQHVLEDLDDRIDAVLDGGVCAVGVESTIISCVSETPRLLRAGGIGLEEIERVLGFALEAATAPASGITAPGQLASHYAPRAAVRLNALQAQPDELLLGFGADAPENTALNLSSSGDLQEAAANLFAFMRELDRRGTLRLAVMPIPRHGLGLAINDRLERAAAPRE